MEAATSRCKFGSIKKCLRSRRPTIIGYSKLLRSTTVARVVTALREIAAGKVHFEEDVRGTVELYLRENRFRLLKPGEVEA